MISLLILLAFSCSSTEEEVIEISIEEEEELIVPINPGFHYSGTAYNMTPEEWERWLNGKNIEKPKADKVKEEKETEISSPSIEILPSFESDTEINKDPTSNENTELPSEKQETLEYQDNTKKENLKPEISKGKVHEGNLTEIENEEESEDIDTILSDIYINEINTEKKEEEPIENSSIDSPYQEGNVKIIQTEKEKQEERTIDPSELQRIAEETRKETKVRRLDINIKPISILIAGIALGVFLIAMTKIIMNLSDSPDSETKHRNSAKKKNKKNKTEYENSFEGGSNREMEGKETSKIVLMPRLHKDDSSKIKAKTNPEQSNEENKRIFHLESINTTKIPDKGEKTLASVKQLIAKNYQKAINAKEKEPEDDMERLFD